jgi:hypothetical protein
MKYTKIFIAVLGVSALLTPVFISNTLEIAPPQPAIAEAAVLGVPTNLNIPNAKVTTNIIEVGITPKGNLDVPGNYTEVGWYKYGTRPGEVGSAVLDGHVDNGGKIPGPFKHFEI